MEEEQKIGISGLSIFCVGLGLLFFVLYIAYTLFQDPHLLDFIASGGEEVFFNNILLTAISLVALAIMGGVSGKIASKGVELFKSRKS
jgi:hypothetical protein